MQTQTVARLKFQRGVEKTFVFAILEFLFYRYLTSTTKIDTLKNHFPLHECNFENTSNYLASKLTSHNNIQRLREVLAQLQTIAAKLEEISEQMSAFMTLDDLEPFRQKSADFALILLHYSDKIDSVTQSGRRRSSSIFEPSERRCED